MSSRVHGFTRKEHRFSLPSSSAPSQFTPRGQPPLAVDVFDMSPLYAMSRADFYEYTQLVTALQGIVNRLDTSRV